MFKKLKDKLKNWTKKLSKETEEKIVEPPKQEKPKEKKTKKQKEIEVPLKFNPGIKKYEPDLEKLEKISKELKEETTSQKPQEPKTHPEKKPGFFSKIKSKVTKVKISEKDFSVYSEELEMLLLENNVALEVAQKIIKKLSEEIVGKEFLKKEVVGQIEDALKDIIRGILLEPFDLIKKIQDKKEKPFVILFCGVNGTGKTTTIAKIANQLKQKGLTSVIAAADTFRAASIEQLKNHAEKLNIKLISHDYGSDPAAVGFDAVKYAQKNRIDVVLIDTAGRMHSEKNLLKELEKISRVNKPDLKIFVGEATTGNDSIEQIRSFDWAVGIDSIILTKADTDEKGGTALSVGFVTKKPILYLGTGQEYKDLTPFNKNKFIEELGL